MTVTDAVTHDELDAKVNGLKPEVERIVGDAVRVLRGEIASTAAGVEARLNDRFDGLETRFDGLETKVDGLETRFDSLETKVDGLETRFDSLETKVDGLETKFDRVEAKLDLLIEGSGP
ncbi:MAG: hypothetical protein F4Y76_11890 [Acidimicrobiales bacterium]|nr:hypothetical protein [Acidimicrobiales bacterium]MYG60371.1 hypothetical protein [Acidimicrobiales bacterium]